MKTHAESTRAHPPGSAHGWLAGKTVVSLESRFPKEFAGLVERRGGSVLQAPSLKEIPNPESDSVRQYILGVKERSYAMVILLTGVGTRMCIEAAERLSLLPQFLEGLARTTTICRGPKPVAVLRKHGVDPTEMAPEPHTSEELAKVLRRRGSEIAGRLVALQHYGADNPFIRDELSSLGATVVDVYPYSWGLPDDTGPLVDAIERIVGGDVSAVCFTSSPQVTNLLAVAQQLGLLADLKQALNTRVISAAVGPIVAASLRDVGITPRIQPRRPKMADLVRELDAFENRQE